MTEFEYYLEYNDNLSFQVGFNREVEYLASWVPGIPEFNPTWPFRIIPSGPVSIATTEPPTGGNLWIAESPNMVSIVNWLLNNLRFWNQTIGEIQTRMITIPPGVDFKRFVTINGPFAGIYYTGFDRLKVTAQGLTERAPSTIQLAEPIRVNQSQQ
jgi:hypothetical protein